jgi:hypothetical protein
MTAKSAIAPAVADPNAETFGSWADLASGLGGFVKFTAKPAKVARPKNAADFRRDVDLAIIAAADKLVTEMVPEEFRAEAARIIANQLHHLSTPALGWPAATLPKPDRSGWR